jgi:hypothetical protein
MDFYTHGICLSYYVLYHLEVSSLIEQRNRLLKMQYLLGQNTLHCWDKFPQKFYIL